MQVITQHYRMALKPEEREQAKNDIHTYLERYEKALTAKFFGGNFANLLVL